MFRKTLIIISVLLFLPLFAPLFVENAVCEDRDPSI